MAGRRAKRAKLHWKNRKANKGVKPGYGSKQKCLKAACLTDKFGYAKVSG